MFLQSSITACAVPKACSMEGGTAAHVSMVSFRHLLDTPPGFSLCLPPFAVFALAFPLAVAAVFEPEPEPKHSCFPPGALTGTELLRKLLSSSVAFSILARLSRACHPAVVHRVSQG